MILRPVTPQSPLGPPISKLPVGLTRYLIGPFMRFFGSTGLITCSITASSICLCATPGLCSGEGPPVAAQLGLALDQTVREIDRHRHELRRLVAGVAEHEALVARTLLEV